ncbi:hypothetical protein [uncultured Acidaminococcus sp.]|uniref:hypothetical protein n=1 Tax=uncultured Acidaminococcus sp. TaxID=352152 RepID=UPI00266F9E75|nr:hypothetical protein [uncultured Acidaminococcus sp.]
MTDNKWKKMIGLVDTMGDWGGYQLYEWFKLFPEQRETALREYIYLKAHLIRGCMTALKKDLSKEEWNEFYLALGKQMEATPDYSYGATYDGLVEALRGYEGQNLAQQKASFAKRSTIDSTVYSQQFVKDLTNFFSRTQAELRKGLRD